MSNLFKYLPHRRHVVQACPSWMVRELRRSSTERVSRLVLRILAVNVLALALLVGSLLYLGQYQKRMIDREIDALMMQARLSANAIAEGAVVLDHDERNILSPLLSRLMIRRLVEANETRTRLFDINDLLIADSQILVNPVGRVQKQKLAMMESTWGTKMVMGFFDMTDRLVERKEYPLFPQEDIRDGEELEVVQSAKLGVPAEQVWRMPEGGLMLSVVVPVQRYRQILGAVMLTRPDTAISQAVQEVRLDTLKIFGVTLFVTALLSLYLARSIVRPLKQLARAADRVRRGQTEMVGLSGTAQLLNRESIPDFSARQDEIGDLSVALQDMTAALAKRIGAIENFAADVAHEIKNPLTSLRSAVETAGKIRDPERQQKLMQVIQDDVQRLDRLITDISRASRLDAELTRDEAAEIDIAKMLHAVVDLYAMECSEARAQVVLDPALPKGLRISGLEVRLGQVLQNLITNALSFSPDNGQVFITARLSPDGAVDLVVEDQGPGIPENKLEAIFDRFYTERPKSEAFGRHSGLGLSISRQIVEAHHGRIWAENRADKQEKIIGARFIVRLPGLRED